MQLRVFDLCYKYIWYLVFRRNTKYQIGRRLVLLGQTERKSRSLRRGSEPVRQTVVAAAAAAAVAVVVAAWANEYETPNAPHTAPRKL